MPTITISIKGNTETQQRLHKLGTSLLNLTDAMKAIGSNFKDFYTEQPFRSQGGIFGDPWPALRPGTIKQKIRYNPTTATYPLIRTTKMQHSFAVESGQNFMRLYNTADYFKYHQLGTSRIPQRMMLALTESRYQAMKDIITLEVRKKIDGAI